MTNKKTYRVSVPATTANIGSGFDVLGLSLSLYNEVHFTPDPSLHFPDFILTAEGEGVNEIPEGKDNIIIQAMAQTAKKIGKALPGGSMHLVNRIPFARGLGSSSAAIVSGVYLANLILGNRLTRQEMLDIAAGMEGHPDNAAPALLGGFVISMMDKDGVRSEKVQISPKWKAIVAIPDFELLTEKARAVLPKVYVRDDTVHNVSAVSFLLAAFFQQNPEYLKLGLADRIHVPYRLPLIPGGKEVILRAEKAGAYGVTISGSGPTMIAFGNEENAEAVSRAMKEGFATEGRKARTEILAFDDLGAHEIN